MQAHVIPVDLGLVNSKLEIIIVNWETIRPGVDLGQIADEWGEGKRRVIEALVERIQDDHREIPLFIVLPEISTPHTLVQLINDELLEKLQPPVIIVAGLEHISHAVFHNDLLGSLVSSDMPDLTYEPDTTARKFNVAAIAVKGNSGSRWFIQPKRKAHHEGPGLNVCEDVLVFQEKDNGNCFSFCVQICSDFNSDAFVQSLRSSAMTAGIDELDLLLLPQFYDHPFNRPETHPQLRTSITSYFREREDAAQQARTRQGVVLLANRARTHILDDDFGDSSLVFPKDTWEDPSKLYILPRSFFFDQHSGSPLQRFRFRRQTPSVHRFTYSPKESSGDYTR